MGCLWGEQDGEKEFVLCILIYIHIFNKMEEAYEAEHEQKCLTTASLVRC